jgi:hypothetical protein
VSALGKSLPTWSGTPRHATPKPAAGGPEGIGRARGITCGAGTLEVRAPRANEPPVNEQEARVPVWEEEYRQFCKRSLEGDNVYVWGGWSALQRTAFG